MVGCDVHDIELIILTCDCTSSYVQGGRADSYIAGDLTTKNRTVFEIDCVDCQTYSGYGGEISVEGELVIESLLVGLESVKTIEDEEST